MSTSARLLHLVGAVIIWSSPAVAWGQDRTDVFRGRVTTDSGAVIAGATVVVTMAPSAQVFRDSTNAAGEYALRIPGGSGEYVLFIGAPGRRPIRQRLTRTADADTTFVVHAALAPNVAALNAVRVQASRPRPARSLGGDAAAGADQHDRTVDGINGALPPELAGNIEALAALVPGLAVTPGGVQAFGVGSESNATLLNGLAFSGAQLPRDVRTTTRYATSPWDPTQGGFSGVLASTTLASGTNITGRTARVSVDHPVLQYSDAAADRLGHRFTNLSASIAGDGPVTMEKVFYHYGAQLSRRSAPVVSLAVLDPTALAHAGVASDSAARVLTLLAQHGVPVHAGPATHRTTTSGSFITRIDRATPAGPPGATPKPVLWGMAYANVAHSEAVSLQPTATPASGGTLTNGTAGVQGLYAFNFGGLGEYVNETTSGVSVTQQRGTPYTALPAGRVLVTSDLADGQGIGAVDFGGNSALGFDRRSWRWEAVNQTAFFLGGRPALPMQLYFQSRLEGYEQTVAADRMGTFTYASLDALEANRPSSFARTLSPADRAGGAWYGAAALGGRWTSGRLLLQGGTRLDANAFTARPEHNPEIARQFDARTDHAPHEIAVSPRLGFEWRFRRQHREASISSGFAKYNFSPNKIRGGVGLFRGTLPGTLLGDAIAHTGLPDGTQRLLCVGPAAPVPAWEDYAAAPANIPTACAEGAATFADAAPSVTLFDEGYRAPRSWRAMLGGTARVRGTHMTLDGTYSRNLHQPGAIDLNFAGTPRFALAAEGNRPVFVSPSSIVPTTGLVSPLEARRMAAFGRVTSRVSDLRSEGRQVTATVMPPIPVRHGLYTLAYTWSDIDAEARGFDLTTAGDPRLIETADAQHAPRHQAIVQASRYFFGKIGVTTIVRAMSGTRYTPLVAADINGDGLANDRAFVFAPGTAPDSAVGEALQALMATGPASARACLRAQTGRIAAPNSCVGPWTASMMLNLYITPTLPGTNQRGRVSLNIANPLAGLDRLLHGNNLHGWGSPALPERSLYQVRGFDAEQQRFLYEVNPRFGSTRPTASTYRAPFRLTLDVSFALGRSRAEQQLEQALRLRPALRGTRAPIDSLKARYGRRNPDIYAALLKYADSLALSRAQVQQVQQERARLQVRVDSAYHALAAYLDTLPMRYDARATVAEVNRTDAAVWEMMYQERPTLAALLTPGQIRLLPRPLMQLVTDPKYRGRFFGL